MNSNTTSKAIDIYNDSDSNALFGLPVFDGKNWKKGWDSITKQDR